MSDVSALTYGYKYEYKKYYQNQENSNLSLADDFKLEVYIRKYGELNGYVEVFETISEVYRKGELNYIVGKVKFSDLQKTGVFEDPNAVVILSSNNCIESV